MSSDRVTQEESKRPSSNTDKVCDQEWRENTGSRSEKAARYVQFQRNMSVWNCLKTYRTTILWIIFSQLVVFGYGIDQSIAAALLATPKFREDFGEPADYGGGYLVYTVPAWWISLYTGISYFGVILGSVLCGWLADRYGRRLNLLVWCLISIAGVGAQYAAKGSLPVLTAGKAINGLATGAFLVLGPVYASEVAPLNIRGWLISITSLSIFSGLLLFTGIMYRVATLKDASSYLIGIASQWIMPVFVLPFIYFLPESPAWLLRVGRREEAIKSMARLYGTNGKINNDDALAFMEESIEHEKEIAVGSSSGFAECFNEKNRRRTLTTAFAYSCQYLSGTIFVIGYQAYYYQIIGYSTSESFLLTMLNNGIMMLAFPLTWYLIGTMGRRPLMVYGQLIAAIWLFMLGGFATMTPGPESRKGSVAAMFLWAFTFQATVSSLLWVIGGEIPALTLRAKTQAIANGFMNFVGWTVSFTFPYMLNPDAGNLGGKIGFVYGGLTIFGFIGTFFLLPETKGRTIEEIDLLYEHKINPRDFSKTDPSILSRAPVA